jgi:hypothetical protein
MRSLLGRFHRPFARGVDEQLLLLNNLGDGSTLSLDFTTGVLDPRLTFTRTTNATFINSQGLVEWANHNLWYNTAFSGLTGTNPTLPASGWNYAGTTGSGKDIVFNGDGSVTTKTPSGTLRCGLQRTTSITNTTLLLAVSLDVVADANATYGTLTASDLVSEGSATDIAFYINGGSVPASTVITGPCNLTWVFQKTGGGTVTPFFGANIRGAKSGAFTIRFANPRFGLWGGVAPFPYFANTSTTAERHDPRFDYDPSTTPPQPRGLLIEGSASNLCPNSQALTTGWGNANMITPTNPAIADPFGGTAATWKLVAASGSALHSWRHPVITLTAAAHTFSFWAKADVYDRVIFSDPGSGIGACTFVLTGNGTATVVGGATNPLITPYPNGWYRCSVTITTLATTYALGIAGYPSSGATLSNFGATYTGNGTDGAYATGLQIELGSGASSYIPTGASQGSRAADVCYIANSDYGFTTTGGTYFVEWERGEFATVSGQACNPFSTDYASGRWLGIGTAPAGTTATAGSWSGFLNATGTAVAGRNRAAVSYSSWVASASGVFRVNGGSEITGTLTLGTTPTYLMIGSASASAPYNGGGLRDFVNSRIRRIKYWPSVLPSATLQAITVNT